MIKLIAKFVSIILHPILIPVYLLAHSLFLPVYSMQRYNQEFKLYLISYIIAVTVILPLVSLWQLKKFAVIDSLQISNQKQRPLPYLLMIVLYSFSAISLSSIQGIHYLIILLFAISAITVLLLVIINYRIKISAHAAGVSMTLPWFMLIYITFNLNTGIYMILSFITLGLVMSSRLVLKAHSQKEVWLGAAIGFLMLTAILII
ncbi:MAG: hypothetical protein JXR34_10110 [Bacteroidales bacterium]|nr:hypothetical protein [Bacteroidales bacterium]